MSSEVGDSNLVLFTSSHFMTNMYKCLLLYFELIKVLLMILTFIVTR